MTLRNSALAAIHRYRTSPFHDHVLEHYECRFTPSCSHYAEDALRLRNLPVALLLIAWRLLRCNRFTPAGRHDPVTPRDPRRVRKAFAVLGLAALTTLFLAGTASAATAPALTGFPTQGGFGPTAGGCTASVAGVPINTLTADHPLQVHKGQGVLLTGRAPAGISNLPSSIGLRSTTDIRIHFIEKVATRSETHNATGQSFQRAVNVDTYLKYGSGMYRVDVHSVAPGGWDCSATFYVEMHGSKLAAEVAVAVGGIGAAGMAASARGDEPDPDALPPKADDQGMVDPTTPVESYEKWQKDRAANTKASSGTACLAGILFALIASTGAFAFALPAAGAVGKGDAAPQRVWTRGHPILGFVSGLFFGLGTTVALQQFNVYPLNLLSGIVAPLVTAVLGAWRGWRGTAWRRA